MTLLDAEGFFVEEEFDLVGVGVDLDVFCVGGLVFRGPVEEERLAEAGGRVEWGVGCCRGLVARGGRGVAGVDGATAGGLSRPPVEAGAPAGRRR